MRILTAPLSLLCSLLAATVILRVLKPDGYAVVAVLASIQSLFTLVDLGTGAAVINGGARYAARHEVALLVRPLKAAVFVSAISASLFLFAACIVAGQGAWPTILGTADSESSGAAVTAAVVTLFALNVVARPACQFQNALVGLGRSWVVVASQVLVPIANLAVVALAALSAAPIVVYAVALPVGQLGSYLIAGFFLLKSVPQLRTSRNVRLKRADITTLPQVAGPMLVIAAVAPLYVALDRVILSHLSSPDAVATYALTSQFFLPISGLFVVLQQALWADLAIRRETDPSGIDARVARIQTMTLIAGFPVALILALAVPQLARLISDGTVVVSFTLACVFSSAFYVQLQQLPSSSLLTRPRELQWQAIWVVASVGANLAVTIALTPSLGALGPAIGTLLGSALLLSLLLIQRNRPNSLKPRRG